MWQDVADRQDCFQKSFTSEGMDGYRVGEGPLHYMHLCDCYFMSVQIYSYLLMLCRLASRNAIYIYIKDKIDYNYRYALISTLFNDL